MSEISRLLGTSNLPRSLRLGRLLILWQGIIGLVLSLGLILLIVLLDGGGHLVSPSTTAIYVYAGGSLVVWALLTTLGAKLSRPNKKLWAGLVCLESLVLLSYLASFLSGLTLTNIISAVLVGIILGLLFSPATRRACNPASIVVAPAPQGEPTV